MEGLGRWLIEAKETMNCHKKGCDKRAPQDTLYRVNAKGRPGIWACQAHRLEPDEELDGIVAAVQRKRCEPCRATDAVHCSDPENCGGPWDKRNDA
jgi:hypothetical protein